MSRCAYPNCFSDARFTPVLELPTIRINHEGDDVVTDQPTFLIFPEVCIGHRGQYNLLDWFGSASDWKYIQEAARSRGMVVPNPELAKLRFEELGWSPKRSLLVLRGKDETDYKIQ